MLQDWAARCANEEDVPMDDEAEAAREIALLKESVEKHRDSMSTNAWIQSLVAAL